MTGDWLTRELTEPAEVIEAVEDVIAWGFPRDIEQYEIGLGSWFRMGRAVVWWYEPPHPVAPHAGIIHLCVNPEVRGRWPVRRWSVAAEVIAELMGFTLLVFWPMGERDKILEYALRLGWRQEGERLVRHLGG